MSSKLLPPVAECRFADVESRTLFADSSDDDVDVGIALVGMQRHRVTMLKRKSIDCERPHRRLEFVGRRALRHREDEIVYEPGRLASVGDRSIGMAGRPIQGPI